MDFDLGDKAALRSRLRALVATDVACAVLRTGERLHGAVMGRATVEVELPGADG